MEVLTILFPEKKHHRHIHSHIISWTSQTPSSPWTRTPGLKKTHLYGQLLMKPTGEFLLWCSRNNPTAIMQVRSLASLSGLRIRRCCCGVGRRHSSDPVLLWLWCRLAAVAPIGPQPGNFHMWGCSPKKKKKPTGYQRGAGLHFPCCKLVSRETFTDAPSHQSGVSLCWFPKYTLRSFQEPSPAQSRNPVLLMMRFGEHIWLPPAGSKL